MSWTWIQPADPSVLEGRPLLDLGTGDGQTLGALVEASGLLVGLDRSPEALRSARRGLATLVCGQADTLPFPDATFATVLAADLFHHLGDERLAAVLTEVLRVLRPDGKLVAWWYEEPGREGPDAPRHPRPRSAVAQAVEDVGFRSSLPLALSATLEPAPPTVGLIATKG